MFQPKSEEMAGGCRSCIICTAHEVLGKSKQGFQDGWVMCLKSETRENTYENDLENVKETGLSEDL